MQTSSCPWSKLQPSNGHIFPTREEGEGREPRLRARSNEQCGGLPSERGLARLFRWRLGRAEEVLIVVSGPSARCPVALRGWPLTEAS